MIDFVGNEVGRLITQAAIGTTILAIAALALCRFYRTSPIARIWICALALGACLALPAASALSMRTGISWLRIPTPASIEAPAEKDMLVVPSKSVVEEAIPTPMSSAPEPEFDWQSAVVAVYCLGLLFGLLKVFLGALEIRRQWGLSREPNADEWALLTQVGGPLLNVFASIRVLDEAQVPMVAGICAPRLFLASHTFQSMNRKELEQVIAHEAAHVTGGHLSLGVLQRTVAVLLWPQPLIFLLLRHLSRAEEEVCDWAALGSGDPADYARLLVRIAERGLNRPMDGLAQSMLNERFPLEDRIRGLMDPHRRIPLTMNPKTRTAACAATIVTAMLLAGVQIGNAQEASDGTAPTVAVQAPPRLVKPAAAPTRPAKAPKTPPKKPRAKTFRSVQSRAKVWRVVPGVPSKVKQWREVPVLSDVPIVNKFYVEEQPGKPARAPKPATSPMAPTGVPAKLADGRQLSAPIAPPATAPAGAGTPTMAPQVAMPVPAVGQPAPAMAPIPQRGVARSTMRKAISVIKNATVILWSDGTTEIRRPQSTGTRKPSKSGRKSGQ